MINISLILVIFLEFILNSVGNPLVSAVETVEINRKFVPSKRNPIISKSLQQPIQQSAVSLGDNQTDSNSNLDSDLNSISNSNVENDTQSHLTKFIAECLMPTTFGNFRMRSYTYSSRFQSLEPIVMIAGDLANKDNVIVRVHDQCFTGEVFGSRRCDCREQLHESLRLVQQDGGIIIYLQQEGRGIGLSNKIAAYSLQDNGMDTVDANVHLGFDEEMREYKAVPDILNDLGIKSIRLVTNNPFKMNELEALGVQITERISTKIPPNTFNIRYLKSKRDRMKHIFPEDFAEDVSDAESVQDSLAWQSSSLRKNANNDKSQSSPSSNPTSSSTTTTPHTINHTTDIKMASSTLTDHVTSLWPGDQDLAVTADSFQGHSHYAFGRATVEAAIAAIKDGQMVLVVDDEGRENEGDLIMSASHATPETVGFIVRHSSGVLCVSMEGSRLNALKLPPMVVNNQDPKQTAYSITVDCVHNTTTGISSADRAVTFRALADSQSQITDFQRPGHVFPLRYRTGGVLTRGGHTEASLDLVKLAKLKSKAAVLAEVVNDDGSIMRLDALKEFAQKHKLVLTSVQDMIAYRVETEKTEKSTQ